MNTRILAIIATAGASFAAAHSAAQDFTAAVTTGFESEYVFRGVQLANESMQASLDVTYGDAYAGIWTNQPTRDRDLSNEVDLYAGYSFAIDATYLVDVGVTAYLYPEDDFAEDTTELFVSFSADLWELTPTVTAYYDFDLEALTLEASASYVYAINEKNAIEAGLAFGWADEDYGQEYAYYNVAVDYVYSLSEAAAFSIGGRVGGNNDHRGIDGHENTAWAGASFRFGY